MCHMAAAPGFLDQPKTDHHIQIMVLCVVLGIIAVIAWVFAMLTSHKAPPVIAPTNMADSQSKVSSMIDAQPLTVASTADVAKIAKRIASKPATTASPADIQAIELRMSSVH